METEYGMPRLGHVAFPPLHIFSYTSLAFTTSDATTTMHTSTTSPRRFRPPRTPFSWPLCLLFLVTLLQLSPVHAIKFSLQSYRFPPVKCIWNPAHKGALVIVTANVSPGESQRVDVEIIDSSPDKNLYLRKKDIKGETRLAITAHADGDVGVCFRNYMASDVSYEKAKKLSRIIDLDVDIGADAVDYNAIANQESLSGLEVELRKLEGIVSEIWEEMGYLRAREERFSTTNASTNQRVQNFAWFTIIALTGLGIWQILHLRAYFKRKYLID